VAHIPCAGAIIFDDAGRLLLIRRGRPPGEGLWSVPGGKCEAGETALQACVREAFEETGLHVRVIRHVGRVLRPGLDEDVFVIDDFLCHVEDGELGAGDDAAQVGWFSYADLGALSLTPGLIEALTEWGLFCCEAV